MNLTKKIVLLGHFGVGKTSLIRQYIDKEFNPEYMVTIGLQVKKKEIEIAGNTLSFIIWDIEGNTSVEKARTSYLLGSSAFIYVVDLTRPETFENLNQELKILQKQFPEIPVVTVGNKTDLTEPDMLQAFLDKRQIKLNVFTSAKTGEQVDNLFYNLAKSLLNNEQ
jgi:small GTP-binding protein